jgi:pyruvate/2-oxoglutarate dehydrogenase complex dihydrolipoamide acyltransferase (E2) component
MAVHPVIMPKLGAYTDDVLLTGWLVDEGQRVAAGGAVLELETEKTTAEVEADTAGFLHQLVPVGQAVPIGTTVGMIADTLEEYEALAGGEGGAAEELPTPVENPFLGYIGQGGPDRVARAAGAVAPAAAPEAPLPAATRRDGPLVSPRARALLRQLGYTVDDLGAIAGTGPEGRVTDRDVAAWHEARGRADPPSAPGGLTVAGEIPLRGRRRTIATRMLASVQGSAQLTSVLELDVKPLVELRARLNEAGAEPRVGVTAIVVKLVAAALREHPILNARVTETAVELLEEINIAVAVDTDAGLVSPVVAHADRRSIEEINARIAVLAVRARESMLTAEDLVDGTFTVSNGGIYPVDITTAILNPPQCGILWIGRIRERPVVVGEGTIAVRPTMQACLTFDHRAVDGAPAAAFLGTLERLVAALPELPA